MSEAGYQGTLSPHSLQFLINHIVLPPKLPQSKEADLDVQHDVLLDFFHQQAVAFENLCHENDQVHWKVMVKMLKVWKETSQAGNLSPEVLEKSLMSMEANGIIAVHINAQNGSLIFRKSSDNLTIIVDSFEASPLTKAVIGSERSLLCTFPNKRSIAVPADKFNDHDFVREVASLISQLNLEDIDEAKAKSWKAGETVPEEREVRNPQFVGILTAILLSVGSASPAHLITKRIRDDVCWDDALLPWRRSPLYLTLRVALQVGLNHLLPDENQRQFYKNFMVFVITGLCRESLHHNLPSHLIHVINLKIVRRLSKRGFEIMDFVKSKASGAVDEASFYLDKHLRTCELRLSASHVSDLSPPTLQDIDLKLDSSRTRISQALSRQHADGPIVSHSVSSLERLELSDGMPVLSSSSRSPLVLLDFEDWVEYHVQDVVGSTSSFLRLKELFDSYYTSASCLYRGFPEQNSIMVLTLLEIWLVMDQTLCQSTPLLQEFTPEIPVSIAASLLLPKLSQLRRLAKIESYLEHRHSNCVSANPSHFFEPTWNSFAAQYYDKFEEFPRLRSSIETDAENERAMRKQVWKDKNAQYYSLIQQAERIGVCSRQSDRWGNEYHSSSCRKCSLEADAKSLCVEIHEWPIPEGDKMPLLKTVVFELSCPQPYATWRDVTWKILQDLGQRAQARGDSVEGTLTSLPALRSVLKDHGQRIRLCSKTKTFAQSHYRVLHFPRTFEDVCKKHALQWHLYDNQGAQWTHDQDGEYPNLHSLCVTPLSDVAYTSLQPNTDETTRSTNEMISKQDKCPQDLDIHEFHAFGDIRYGEETQWLEILLELSRPVLTLNTEAVATHLLQTAIQSGTSFEGKEHRLSHALLIDDCFATKLLDKLQMIESSILANWKEEHSMFLLINLSLRVGQLTKSAKIKRRSLQILNKLRDITYEWMKAISEKLSEQVEEISRTLMQRKLLKCACLCRQTFDIDAADLDLALTQKSFAMFVEAATLVHDNIPGDISHLGFDLRRSIFRDRRIAHRLQEEMCSIALQRSDYIDLGLQRVWPTFSASGPWKRTIGDRQAWISVDTEAGQAVSFNVYSGELLVNGQHLSILPRKYMEHRTYIRLFRAQILKVIPSNLSYMSYMTLKPVAGKVIYFSMDGDLIVRAIDKTGVTELIPDSCFGGDLPFFMISTTTQWINVESQVIDFRPLSSTWEIAACDIRLSFSNSGPSQALISGKKLIEYQSQLGQKIVQILSPLETKQHLLITMNENDNHKLEVKLQRFGITFFLNDKRQLESNDLAGTIDSSQSVGTLIGLQSRLIIKHLPSYPGTSSRSIIVPFGKTLLDHDIQHVQVRISSDENLGKVTWFRYDIDTMLCQLTSRRNDQLCLLFKIYLHALTGHCRPDPLLRRTGTEEAICCLRDPVLLPISPLDSSSSADLQVLQILKNIAGLTPTRQIYPKHLRKMQSVSWNPMLSPIAQHDEFIVLAERIVAHSNRLIPLSIDEILPFSLESQSDATLLKKARIRNASLRSHEFGANFFKGGQDARYSGQDSGEFSSSTSKTYEISSLLNAWPSQFHVGIDLPHLFREWNHLNYRNESVEQFSLNELLHLHPKDHWGGLYNMCRGVSSESEKYALMFLFGKMAFGETDVRALRFLIAVAVSPISAFEPPPGPESYDLGKGSVRERSCLVENIKPLFQDCTIDARTTSNWKAERERFAQNVRSQIDELVGYLMNVPWPTQFPTIPPETRFPLLESTASLATTINPLFKPWFENFKFDEHVIRGSQVLKQIHRDSTLPRLPHILESYLWGNGKHAPLYEPDCISSYCKGTTPHFGPAPEILHEIFPTTTHKTGEMAELKELMQPFVESRNRTDQLFGFNLGISINALFALPISTLPTGIDRPMEYFEFYTLQCKNYTEHIFDEILQFIRERAPSLYRLQENSGLSPRLTPTSLLRLIATASPLQPPNSWKKIIVTYGLSLTMLQRAARLERLAKIKDVAAFYKELENRGHEIWDAMLYPDWLLMEIEGGFLIRSVQAEVAFEMISPSSGQSSVAQLNMGEGKSSVIISLIAAVVANGKNLARVVVLKALINAMAGILSARLGGMCNRTIYFSPFSRKTSLDDGTLDFIFSLWDDCSQNKGILLAQPEHLQSFKLIGFEQISQKECLKARRLLEKRRHWEQNGRNIIDESDAVLDAKNQLIYTIGTQQAIDGESDRWQLIEELLTLVSQIVRSIPKNDDLKVAYSHETAFPSLIVRQGVMTGQLNQHLVNGIVNGAIQNLHFPDCDDNMVREDLKAFIIDPEISDDAQTKIIKRFDGTRLKKIVLLRGLIAGGVLAHSLYLKRWLVEYGSAKRTLLAVPYIAKGVPSANSEFGHPDVAIILTCLEYYMSGLTDEQIYLCFEMLYKSPDPSDTYATLRRCECWPASFASLKGVNLDDTDNIRTFLYPHLKYNKDFIDFFLSSVVFPKECKEFPKKLTTSAWDIPPSDKGLTTGFSGTNDNRYLLPLAVNQVDLRALVHTSAMVLCHILRPNNRRYQCIQDVNHQRLSVDQLLDFLSRQQPRVNVLIDIGAQVIEVPNKELARIWLSKMPGDVEAALYFDSEDQQIILNRDGKMELLAASKYQDRLENCLVYMDEVHTRGTDIKLPPNFKAAVTLGPRVTKDRFVQGCMRMRGLGRGQSIMTLACPEVDKEVRELRDLANMRNGPLSSLDVLRWCLEQTRLTTQRNMPLWVHHGITYYSNKNAEEKFFASLDSGNNSDSIYQELIEAVQENDATTLLDMYGPRASSATAAHSPSDFGQIDSIPVQKLMEARQTLGIHRMRSSALNEEQEKEVAHEKEVETEIERPPRATPLPHGSDEDVKRFIETGRLSLGKPSNFSPAFEIFSHTSAKYHGTITTPNMLATYDFANSVKSNPDDILEQYLKSTNYILTRVEGDPVLVFISQYEANRWFEVIKASKAVCMHIFAPRNARDMNSLDDLELFTLPSSTKRFKLTTDLRLLLGIFSGQLYLNNFDEYQRLRKLLLECFVPPTGLMTEDDEDERYKSWVKSEMLEFVRSVFEIRRKGQDFSRSHMGRIVNGEVLKEMDFDSR